MIAKLWHCALQSARSDAGFDSLLEQLGTFVTAMENEEMFAHFEFVSDRSLLELDSGEGVRAIVLRHLQACSPGYSGCTSHFFFLCVFLTDNNRG